MYLDEATFVVTDTETTGVRAGDDRIIELAAVKVRKGTVIDRFTRLVNPKRHIPGRITRYTGITDAAVFDAPTAAQVLPDYLDFLGDGIFVAHNLTFDQRFLNAELERAGLPPLQAEMLCTLRLARRVLRALRSKSLDSLKDHFGIRTPRSHRALDDAEATAVILNFLLNSLKTESGIETLGEVLLYQHQRYGTTLREPKHVTRIREEIIPEIPDQPGVYFHKNARGGILYIGKAKRLRTRVRTYFTGIAAHPPRTKRLVQAVRTLDWIETGSELGALLLESRLIKEHKPRFNRALRRYRNRPFIRLDTTHAYPDVSWTFDVLNDGAKYFGPLKKRDRAEELIELIDKLFKLRECDEHIFQLGKACMYAEMNRCPAPCADETVRAQYAAEVERVERFLVGADTSILDDITTAMQEAATELNFELAGWYRDQHRRLSRVLTQQQCIAAPVLEHNGVLVQPGVGERAVDLLLIRFGRLVETINLTLPIKKRVRTHLRKRLAEWFDPDRSPPERYRKEEVDEIRILADWLYHHRDTTEYLAWNPEVGVEGLMARLPDVVEEVIDANVRSC